MVRIKQKEQEARLKSISVAIHNSGLESNKRKKEARLNSISVAIHAQQWYRSSTSTKEKG